jgi:hypothetical protein
MRRWLSLLLAFAFGCHGSSPAEPIGGKSLATPYGVVIVQTNGYAFDESAAVCAIVAGYQDAAKQDRRATQVSTRGLVISVVAMPEGVAAQYLPFYTMIQVAPGQERALTAETLHFLCHRLGGDSCCAAADRGGAVNCKGDSNG